MFQQFCFKSSQRRWKYCFFSSDWKDLSLLLSRYTTSRILPFQIYITVTLWWPNNPSELLVFIILFILHNRLHTTEGEWMSRLKEEVGVGVGVGAACPFLICRSVCILWHWVIFSAIELSLLQMCEEEAERHAWRGICSWRVLCHWRSLHRLSAQHPPSFVLCPMPMQHFCYGTTNTVDVVSVCALVN